MITEQPKRRELRENIAHFKKNHPIGEVALLLGFTAFGTAEGMGWLWLQGLKTNGNALIGAGVAAAATGATIGLFKLSENVLGWRGRMNQFKQSTRRVS